MSYSVLIIDDHPVFRRGIATVVEQELRLKLVGESGAEQEGLLLFSNLRPKVVLLNLSSGSAATVRQLHAIDASVSVIILSRYSNGEDIHDVVRAGARGYIWMNTSVAELLRCVLQVAQGGRYLTPCAVDKLANAVWREALSRRELDILKLVSTGKTNRDIAKAAGICEETVKSHVNKILSKLGAASRTEAVSVAVRRGVIQFA